jgi:uncharacterized OB-fold protein
MTSRSRISEVLAAFPDAIIDADNLAWFDGLLHGEVRINRCRACRTWHNPPGSRCPSCLSPSLEAVAVTGAATVDLATVLHTGPPRDGIDYVEGHPVVSVCFDEVPAVRVTASAIGCAPAQIRRGLRVVPEVVARAGIPTLVFRPLEESQR